MTDSTTDPEMQLLVEIARELEVEFPSAVPSTWKDSPFSWLKEGVPSRRKGMVFELMVERYCKAHDLSVSASPDSEADRIIEGRRVEIKGSTLWDGGFYKFQQIRDQDYDFVLGLGLSPLSAHCWVVPKGVMILAADGQHGGKSARDTWWVEVDPDDPPKSLTPYGGSLSAALPLLKQLSA